MYSRSGMAYSYDRIAKAFPTDKALNEYLKSHPKADKRKHYVESPQQGMERADKARGKAKEKRHEKNLRDSLKNGPGDSINWNYDPKKRKKEEEDKANAVSEQETEKKRKKEAYSYDRRIARDFATPEALKKYLRDHPDADPGKHQVTRKPGDKGVSTVRVRTDRGVADAIKDAIGDEKGTVQTIRKWIEVGKKPSVAILNRAVDEIKGRLEGGDDSPEKKRKLKELQDTLKEYTRS